MLLTRLAVAACPRRGTVADPCFAGGDRGAVGGVGRLGRRHARRARARRLAGYPDHDRKPASEQVIARDRYRRQRSAQREHSRMSELASESISTVRPRMRTPSVSEVSV